MLDDLSAFVVRAVDWKFAAGFDVGRRRALEAWESFEAVTTAVVSEAKDREVRQEACLTRNIPPAARIAVVFSVSHATFDAFYNSPVGYRAQFLIDPDHGQAANARLIAQLAGEFALQWPIDPLLEPMTPANIMHSLCCPSAKIWIHEDHLGSRVGGLLDVDKWRAAAASGVHKARLGLEAPTGFTLELKGAFVDSHGNEYVPDNKRRRRFELHDWGFS